MSAEPPSVHVLVINVNPSARTRTGTRALVRTFARLLPGAKVHERHFLRLHASAPAGVDLVVIGPQGVPFDAYPAQARRHLFELLRATATGACAVDAAGRPVATGYVVFGVCGGHQALALAFGGALAPVHGGRATGTYDGHRKETGQRGVAPTGVVDPLGAILPGQFVVSHVEAVAVVPSEFLLIGRGEPCAVQLVRHASRAVWGVQFHPERGGDGDRLLLGLVRLLSRKSA